MAGFGDLVIRRTNHPNVSLLLISPAMERNATSFLAAVREDPDFEEGLWCDSNRSHIARLPVYLDGYFASAGRQSFGQRKHDLG